MSVEQAAERLRRWYQIRDTSERHGHIYASLANGGSCHCADEQTVLDAWLDPAPLSEEILRASGWYLQGERDWTHTNAILYLTYCRKREKWDVGIAVYDLGYIKTVGDLRRLLSALHIDVEVRLP